MDIIMRAKKLRFEIGMWDFIGVKSDPKRRFLLLIADGIILSLNLKIKF